jgi:hypothetical protein
MEIIMHKFSKRKTVVLAALALVGLSSAAPAQGPELALLLGLEPGNWTLVERGSTSAPISVCLGDPKLLLQVQHIRSSCSRFVIEDTPGKVTVSYKCGGLGHGVTEIRKETSKLVQISSQGIDRGSPFAFTMEGRKTGACK